MSWVPCAIKSIMIQTPYVCGPEGPLQNFRRHGSINGQGVGCPNLSLLNVRGTANDVISDGGA
ncbi:MAG: hypothetical protein AMXMBFR20_13260 [Planctomycetia bacterium]